MGVLGGFVLVAKVHNAENGNLTILFGEPVSSGVQGCESLETNGCKPFSSKEDALDRVKRARDLIREIDMPGRVN